MFSSLPYSETLPKHLVATSLHFQVRRQPIKSGAFRRLFTLLRRPFLGVRAEQSGYLDCKLGLPVDLQSLENKVSRASRPTPNHSKISLRDLPIRRLGYRRRLLHRLLISTDRIFIPIRLKERSRRILIITSSFKLGDTMYTSAPCQTFYFIQRGSCSRSY